MPESNDAIPARLEFRLIERLRRLAGDSGVILGIGDDAAVLEPAPGAQLVVCTDTLVAGVHFLPDTRPEDIGYKALAVNLSDLAAMGATPRWALLALTVPFGDEEWLDAFADGWQELASTTGVALVGGDLTEGPLSVTVQLLGEAPAGTALTRAGARAGDRIAVTGTLGDAALALQRLQAGDEPPAELRVRLDRPTPRLAAGEALRGLASACIDISDGLGADLGHLVEASGVGARVELSKLPLSSAVEVLGGEALALSGGDDYELCFSYPLAKAARVRRALAQADTPWAEIGEITAEPEIQWVTADGGRLELGNFGYAHFEE